MVLRSSSRRTGSPHWLNTAPAEGLSPHLGSKSKKPPFTAVSLESGPFQFNRAHYAAALATPLAADAPVREEHDTAALRHERCTVGSQSRFHEEGVWNRSASPAHGSRF
jgi:hypothetical protein